MALRNPQMERFAVALLSNVAAGMARSKAAHEAALTAGYSGKSVAANARKMAQRKDVKARMLELAAPAVERMKDRIEATVEWATGRLCDIAGPDLGEAALEVSDQIAALRLLAQISGWISPTRTELTGQGGSPLTPVNVNIIRFSDVDNAAA